MKNTESFDRLEARLAGPSELDISFSRRGPTDRDLGLIGEVAGKRTLDVGSGSGQAATSFALRGATSIAVDTSAERIERARRRAEDVGAKVEWHLGDLSELAFLRADSIDIAFSAYAIGEFDDIGRLFRQVHRVLKPSGVFVFSYEHPMATALRAGRSAFDEAPLTVTRDGKEVALYPHAISHVVTTLNRAGFRIDALIEPEPAANGAERAKLPSTIIWRARKEGV